MNEAMKQNEFRNETCRKEIQDLFVLGQLRQPERWNNPGEPGRGREFTRPANWSCYVGFPTTSCQLKMEKHFQWLDCSFWELCRGFLEIFALSHVLFEEWKDAKHFFLTLWNHYVDGNYILCWNKIPWRELGLLLWIRYSHYSWVLCSPLHSGKSLLCNLHQGQDKNLYTT